MRVFSYAANVVWFFERDAIELQLETRFDPTSRIYSVIRRQSDGSTSEEKILGEETCRQRLQGIESDLYRDGWRQSRSPIVLV
jgi:hypothetical protein